MNQNSSTQLTEHDKPKSAVENASDVHISFDNVSIYYGKDVALQPFSMQIKRNEIFGIIGPANAGKTSLLKSINRTLDFIPSAKVSGSVKVN